MMALPPQEIQDTVKALFKQRISTRVQAPKIDDLWPSEWPWALLDGKLPKRRISTEQGLMRASTEEWRQKRLHQINAKDCSSKSQKTSRISSRKWQSSVGQEDCCHLIGL
eukprot:9707665-Karenia_brevis.AAC.1